MSLLKRRKRKLKEVAVYATDGPDRALRIFSTIAQAERWIIRQDRRNERNFVYRNYYIDASPRAEAINDKRIEKLRSRLQSTLAFGGAYTNSTQTPVPQPRPVVPDFTEVL